MSTGSAIDQSVAIAADAEVSNILYFNCDDASLNVTGFTADRVFKAKGNFGLKFGTASAPGSLKLKLNKKIRAFYIEIGAAYYNAQEKVIVINDTVYNNLNQYINGYSKQLSEPVETDEIEIFTPDSAKRAYVQYVRVRYETSDITTQNVHLGVNAGEDIFEKISKATEDFEDQGKEIGNLIVDINGDCFISNPIEATSGITINGNGYTIDASQLGEKATGFINIAKVNGNKAKKADGSDSKYSIYNDIYLNNVNITGLAKSLINNAAGNVKFDNVRLNNANIEIVGKNTIFALGNGYPAQLTISESTLWSKAGHEGFLFQAQGRPMKDVNADETTSWTIDKSTLYQIAKGKKMNNNNSGIKGQTCLNITLTNSILFNTGSSKGNEINGWLFGQNSTNPNAVFDNNCYWADGAVAAGWTDKSKTGYDASETSIAEEPVFADAANGDFSIPSYSELTLKKVGDPEWIPSVNGDWYDVAYRVAQTTYDPNYGSSWMALVQFSSTSIGYGTWSDRVRHGWNNPSGAIVGSTVRIDIDMNNYSGYSLKEVKAFAYADWNSAKAPRRAAEIGMLKDIEVKQINDTAYYFIMPEANVVDSIIFATNVDASWVEYADLKQSSLEYTGSAINIDKQIVITDKHRYARDENNNIIYDEDNNRVNYTLVKGKDYEVIYENNVNAGNAKAIVKGINDYAGEYEIGFEIFKTIETSEEDGINGDYAVKVLSEEEKTAEVIAMIPNEGETSFTIPAATPDGYTIVSIKDGALQNAGDITDIYLPAIGEDGEGIIEIPENALLPAGFTHPKDMFTVHVPVQVLDNYANEPGLEKFAKYSHLVAEVTIPESGYATFSTGIKVQFDEDVVVSYVVNYSAEAVKKEAVKSNMVKAFTGVLLYGEPGEHTVYAINDNTQIEDVEENLLEAVTFATNFDADDADYSYFILKDGKFYAIADNNNEVPSCKAVLKIAKTEAAAAALVLDIIDGISTGIRSIDAANLKDGQLYDLNGRKVSKAQKGVFILNGKKVVVK